MSLINKQFLFFLCAAYHYYWGDGHTQIMSDSEYDALAKIIYKNRTKIKSKYKKLIFFADLVNTSSLCYIKEKDYPQMLKEIKIVKN